MGLNLKLLQQFSILLAYVVNTRSPRMLLRVISCNLTTLMMAFSWHDHSMKKSDLQRLGVVLSPWMERELMSTCNNGATMDEDKLRLKPCMHCKSMNIVGVSHFTVIRSYPASLDQSKLFMTSASTNYFPRRERHLQFPLSLFTKSLQKILRDLLLPYLKLLNMHRKYVDCFTSLEKHTSPRVSIKHHMHMTHMQPNIDIHWHASRTFEMSISQFYVTHQQS